MDIAAILIVAALAIAGLTLTVASLLNLSVQRTLRVLDADARASIRAAQREADAYGRRYGP